MTSLDIYKKYKEEINALDFVAFCEIDYWIKNPTDEEYETITNVCTDAYTNANVSCDFVSFCSDVCSTYADNDISLQELKEMSCADILDYFEPTD